MLRSAPLAALCALSLLFGGCAGSNSNPLPAGQAAYASIDLADDLPDEDLVRPGDHLAIRVLGEPELTSDAYIVSSKGMIQVPLAGEIAASGKSASALRDELVGRLGARFIRDPQVSVTIVERRRTTFAVEGDVREPGIFEAVNGTTLLSAIAQAKSTSETARLDEVMIFRQANGQRMGARFNLDDIRKGRATDPQVLAGDTIVVGRSGLKQAWKQFLQAAPAFNLFYIFR